MTATKATVDRRRFPLDPLIERAEAMWRPGEGHSDPQNEPTRAGKLASALGISVDTVRRQENQGLTERRADQWAVTLGTHPALLWPEWYEVDD